jgi:uncharacterized membrane-anchored protein YitT (DUF2179 family)
MPRPRPDHDAKTVLWNLVLIAAGSYLCAVAVNGILIPHRFLSAGFTGLALIITYLWQDGPNVAAVYGLINIPVFVLGWRLVGRRFLLYSLAGAAVFTLALEVAAYEFPVQDRIMAALLAGIVNGLGAGLILRSAGSAGGSDILSVIMVERFSIRLGSTTLGFNAIVLAGAALLYSLDGALYTLVFLFVSTHVMNLVVTGLSQRKAVFIISPFHREIARSILERLRRGATLLPAEGAYTGQQEKAVYTVVSFQEIGRLKRIVKDVDPGAFVVVTDTREVMGLDIGNQPHWGN